MAQTHDPDHDHDHPHGAHMHPAAPMVDEVSDFEILEIAVRELAIDLSRFLAHRKETSVGVSFTGPPTRRGRSVLSTMNSSTEPQANKAAPAMA